MASRNLYHRARPFRFGCYWATACICLLLLETHRPWWQLAVAAVFFALWPVLELRLTRRAAKAADVSAALYTAFYCAECAVTGAVLSWASLPPLASATGVVALLAGAAAQAGWRLLVIALPALCLGQLMGAAVSTGLTTGSTSWADGVSVLVLLSFSVSLADLSYRQTLRLNARRRALASRSAALEKLNNRLENYIPQSLRLRLHQSPDGPDGPDGRRSWERRWLTVAFVDLVGFTRLVEQSEAEALAEVLNEYLEALAGTVECQRGEVSKLMGDGVLVAFGLLGGTPRRAAALDCLNFCQQLPEIMNQLARHGRLRGELLQLRMRAGVASGYCTLGDWGGNGRLDFTMIGAPVNLASRLQTHARSNGFLVDAPTAALSEHAFALGNALLLDIRGMGEVQAYPSVDRGGGSDIVPAPLRSKGHAA